MISAIIGVDGVVVNVIEGEANPSVHKGLTVIYPATPPVGIGHVWDGKTFEPHQAAPIVSARKLTRLEFMGRFTDAEQSAIYTQAQTNADAQRWLDAVRMATPDPGTDLAIDLDDPRVAAGLAEFETAGILAPGRISEILA